MTYIKANELRLDYPVYNARSYSLRNQLINIGTGGYIERDLRTVDIVTALNKINFHIKEGDAVGLTGHNGAGKSTLLRVMAGIYQPTSGLISRVGSVSTMFDLGAGMEPDLTGMENIYRVFMLMGKVAGDVIKSLDSIIEFTQLGDFLNLPMRTYSSGMIARLMFALVTSIESEILLVDEIFGVGDEDFQSRAKARMEEKIESVKIFVLSSHNNDLIKKYCNRIFKLTHGHLEEIDIAQF
jgi:ABC-type polysaccharide/polyol phosphate transport system ATPase subunit